MAGDDGVHAPEILIQNVYGHRRIKPVTQGGEPAQVGEQHRRGAAPRGIAARSPGQLLHDIGRDEVFELTLELFELVLGDREQPLQLPGPVAQHQCSCAKHHDQHQHRCQQPEHCGVAHSSSIASRTVALASAATPIASRMAASPISAASVAVCFWTIAVW